MSWVYWFIQVSRWTHVLGRPLVMPGVGELPRGRRVAPSQRGGPWDVRGARVEIRLSPLRSCASALSAGSDSPRSAPASQRLGWDFGGSRRDVPYLLGPCPQEPRLRAGIFHHALFMRWETFPQSSCLLRRFFFFNGSPNTHKNDGCALYFPALFLSARSRWPVPKPLARAPLAPAWGSLRCLGMLQLGAADGNSILNGSDDAVRASKLCAPAPMPKSHLLVLCGSATLGANTHLCHPARSPSPQGQASGQTPGILLQESSGPRCAGCCAQGCTPKRAVHEKRARVLWQGWGDAWHHAECPAML